MFLLTFLSLNILAQVNYTSGHTKVIKYGQNDGHYSASFLSPVGQGGAGSSPKEVKTELAFGSYTGPSAFEKNTSLLKNEQKELDDKYQKQVFSLFENNYFPNKEWNGTALVEKVYGILSGIRGDKDEAYRMAYLHRKFKLTNLSDLALWGEVKSNAELKQKYVKEYLENYKKLPTSREIEEFFNIFYAIKNSIPWSGLCHQFSAANADPMINQMMAQIKDREGDVFLCQKPISLGEIKEATTMLYDAIQVDTKTAQGGRIHFTPDADPKSNVFIASDLDFTKKYAVGEAISATDLEYHRKRYSTFVYQNYYERLGKHPAGMGFCELDKMLVEHEADDKKNAQENKTPIMNLHGSGEIWNNPIVETIREVKRYDVMNDSISEGGQSQSLGTIIQHYMANKLSDQSTPGAKNITKHLLRNVNVICSYAEMKNMTLSKMYCDQINNNLYDDVPLPLPCREGQKCDIQSWAKFPQKLAQANKEVDQALFALAKSFIVMETADKAYTDSKGLPRLRSTDVDYFNKFKFQQVNLKLKYIDHASFSDNDSNPKVGEVDYQGIVLVDESQKPAQAQNCSWKNIWNFNPALKRYESTIPASFVTLDIPACPKESKAQDLLNKVSGCATFKELIKAYNGWMLKASTGYEPNKLKMEIKNFKDKYPQTNIDFTKLEKQILAEAEESFIEERKK